MESRVETLLNAVINGETIDFEPQSRMEEYLKNCINKTGTEGLPTPQSRVDALLYKLAEMIHNSDDSDGVYEAGFAAGKSAEWSAFWDAYQGNGSRGNYKEAFSNAANGVGAWNRKTFKPKYDIIITSSGEKCFQSWGISLGSDKVDISQLLAENGVQLDTSGCTMAADMFSYGFNLIGTIPTIDLSSAKDQTWQIFGDSPGITKIEKLIVTEQTWFNNMFRGCNALTDLVIEGTITHREPGLNVQSCPLTHDSLMSIINTLKDYSGTETIGTVVLGAANIAKLSAEELAIIENKQWQYS